MQFDLLIDSLPAVYCDPLLICMLLRNDFVAKCSRHIKRESSNTKEFNIFKIFQLLNSYKNEKHNLKK